MNPDDELIARRLAAALERWRANNTMVPASRASLNVSCLIEIGTCPVFVRVVDGMPASVEVGARLMRSWDFAIRAPTEAWEAHWQSIPAPGDHDIFALAKSGRLVIEGELQPFMAHLFFFKALVGAPRNN